MNYTFRIDQKFRKILLYMWFHDYFSRMGVRVVTEAKCLLKNNNGKHTIYLKLDLVTDSMFPLPISDPSENKRYLKVYFNDKNQLTLEGWNGKTKQ